MGNDPPVCLFKCFIALVHPSAVEPVFSFARFSQKTTKSRVLALPGKKEWSPLFIIPCRVVSPCFASSNVSWLYLNCSAVSFLFFGFPALSKTGTWLLYVIPLLLVNSLNSYSTGL